jgi:ketosteroid isomerase-like protein
VSQLGPGRSADWEAFQGDFLPEAPLTPAARPVKRQTVEAFMARMQGLGRTALASFHERVLGTEVQVFGNVAVAMAGCEITENGGHVTRGVEMLLLVKTDGAWRIAAQAWDTEGGGQAAAGNACST